MPWTNQSGNGGSGKDGGGPIRGPWGGGSSGGGMRPPDLDAILRRGQDRLRDLMPRGLGRNGLLIAILALLGIWLVSGFYQVRTYEQGIVLRFGKFVARTGPGINYHLPWPIEVAYTPNVFGTNQINVGYRKSSESSDNTQTEDIPDESLMLTGDENIVNVSFTVFWQVKDAVSFLFNVENAQDDMNDTIKAVAESAMREVVGQNPYELLLTTRREEVQVAVQRLMQKILDSYGAGVLITSVQTQKVEPPEDADVREAYIDVQKALADQDRKRNEGEAYANRVIPQARGAAAQIEQDAEAYRQQAIAQATGEAKRFLSVLSEYRKAPDVTRRRMYLETMSTVLAPMNKVIVDDSAKGVVPYFQLPSMLRPQGSQQGQSSQSLQMPRTTPQASSGDQPAGEAGGQ
jgi:membrane protease subunit HflK